MIFRIEKRKRRAAPRQGEVRSKNRFLLLPKNITHDDRYIIRWAERAKWAEEFVELPDPSFREQIRALRFTSFRIYRWKTTKWLDIEEAAVDGLNKLNTVAENPVEQYPYK
mgnify:CR=1 FL=1